MVGTEADVPARTCTAPSRIRPPFPLRTGPSRTARAVLPGGRQRGPLRTPRRSRSSPRPMPEGQLSTPQDLGLRADLLQSLAGIDKPTKRTGSRAGSPARPEEDEEDPSLATLPPKPHQCCSSPCPPPGGHHPSGSLFSPVAGCDAPSHDDFIIIIIHYNLLMATLSSVSFTGGCFFP